jgi:nicotinamide mononucleotide transporter
LTPEEILEKFIYGMKQTTWYEYVAVFTGLLSVWYSRAENILTYPVGIINTVIYIYISIKGSLFGEATVNLYYTIMSISGWIIWARRNSQSEHIVCIK